MTLARADGIFIPACSREDKEEMAEQLAWFPRVVTRQPTIREIKTGASPISAYADRAPSKQLMDALENVRQGQQLFIRWFRTRYLMVNKQKKSTLKYRAECSSRQHII